MKKTLKETSGLTNNVKLSSGECHRAILPSSGQYVYNTFASEQTWTKTIKNVLLFPKTYCYGFVICFNTCQLDIFIEVTTFRKQDIKKDIRDLIDTLCFYH